jgi:hypothetical protein
MKNLIHDLREIQAQEMGAWVSKNR